MQARGRLCQTLVDSLRGPRSDLDEAQLAGRLTAVIAGARAAWPAVTVGDERFAAYLATRIPEDGPVLSGIDRLRTADLWLACACGDLDPDALASVDTRTRGPSLGEAQSSSGSRADASSSASSAGRSNGFRRQRRLSPCASTCSGGVTPPVASTTRAACRGSRAESTS